MTDEDLDMLLAKLARTEDRAVPAHLMSRVLNDAETARPRPPAPRPPWYLPLLNALGGWSGPAAIAASLCLGVGLGLSGPEALTSLPFQPSVFETVSDDGLDALGLGTFDLSSVEW